MSKTRCHFVVAVKLWRFLERAPRSRKARVRLASTVQMKRVLRAEKRRSG